MAAGWAFPSGGGSHQESDTVAMDAVTLTIELPDNLNAALKAQARAKGVSEAGLVQQVLEQALIPATLTNAPASELPILHLGVMGALHRGDRYDDVP